VALSADSELPSGEPPVPAVPLWQRRRACLTQLSLRHRAIAWLEHGAVIINDVATAFSEPRIVLREDRLALRVDVRAAHEDTDGASGNASPVPPVSVTRRM